MLINTASDLKADLNLLKKEIKEKFKEEIKEDKKIGKALFNFINCKNGNYKLEEL